jgi:hypothetical protein
MRTYIVGPPVHLSGAIAISYFLWPRYPIFPTWMSMALWAPMHKNHVHPLQAVKNGDSHLRYCIA